MGSIKEQVYLEKLNQLKDQLQMLVAGTHSEYVLQSERLQVEQNKATEFHQLCRQLEIERVERDCENEKTAALREFEEKRAELRESLITELEERRRQIEHEYQTMELTSDNIEAKPMKTRNLRRRYNEPAPPNESKRTRKASPTLILTLSSSDISEDLKLITAATANLPQSSAGTDGRPVLLATSIPSLRMDGSPESVAPGDHATSGSSGMDREGSPSKDQIDVVIEDGKLIYQKKCYTRGQPVYVEMPPDSSRTAAVVQTVGLRELTLRLSNGKRMHVTLSQLQQGKCVLLRRPA